MCVGGIEPITSMQILVVGQESLHPKGGGAKNFGIVIDPKVCVAHAVASDCLLAPFDFIPYL